jgi:hypothetical protein
VGALPGRREHPTVDGADRDLRVSPSRGSGWSADSRGFPHDRRGRTGAKRRVRPLTVPGGAPSARHLGATAVPRRGGARSPRYRSGHARSSKGQLGQAHGELAVAPAAHRPSKDHLTGQPPPPKTAGPPASPRQPGTPPAPRPDHLPTAAAAPRGSHQDDAPTGRASTPPAADRSLRAATNATPTDPHERRCRAEPAQRLPHHRKFERPPRRAMDQAAHPTASKIPPMSTPIRISPICRKAPLGQVNADQVRPHPPHKARRLATNPATSPFQRPHGTYGGTATRRSRRDRCRDRTSRSPGRRRRQSSRRRPLP